MFRTIISAPALLAALWCFSAPANADIWSDRSDLAKECLAALNTGDSTRANQIAEEIKTWPFVFSTKLRAEALECLNSASGEPWTYNTAIGRFRSAAEIQGQLEEDKLRTERKQEADRLEAERAATEKETVRQRVCELRVVVTETNQTLKLAEAAQQGKSIETLATTIKECSTWLESDARAALTNDVCNSIFSSGGLPNTEISGPTTLEILLAELTKKNANDELKILIDFGISLETYAAMAAEMGLSESGDQYACDQ